MPGDGCIAADRTVIATYEGIPIVSGYGRWTCASCGEKRRVFRCWYTSDKGKSSESIGWWIYFYVCVSGINTPNRKGKIPVFNPEAPTTYLYIKKEKWLWNCRLFLWFWGLPVNSWIKIGQINVRPVVVIVFSVRSIWVISQSAVDIPVVHNAFVWSIAPVVEFPRKFAVLHIDSGRPDIEWMPSFMHNNPSVHDRSLFLSIECSSH